MTPLQTQILKGLIKVHFSQQKDSAYFDPKTGGVHANELAQLIGLDADLVAEEAKTLEKDGYCLLLDRGNKDVPYMGIQATEQALEWARTEVSAEMVVVAAAESQAKMRVEEVADIDLGLIEAYDQWEAFSQEEKNAVMKNILKRFILTKEL